MRYVRLSNRIRGQSPPAVPGCRHNQPPSGAVPGDLGLGRFTHTTFVEQLDLTMRQGVSALIRRTRAMARSAPELALPLEWWRGYPGLAARAGYHFVRYHQALRVTLAYPIDRGGGRLPQHCRPQTRGHTCTCSAGASVAAGVTHHCCSYVWKQKLRD